MRTYSNESINKTIRTLALILDDAEDAGWVDRNVARGRRTREPLERRRRRAALEPDDFIDLLEAAGELDGSRRKPQTLERAAKVRALRDEQDLTWSEIAQRVGIAPSTAVYLYRADVDRPTTGVRRAIIATLALAGPRVTELCMLNNVDVDLAKARIYIADSKTRPASEPSISIRGSSTSSGAIAPIPTTRLAMRPRSRLAPGHGEPRTTCGSA